MQYSIHEGNIERLESKLQTIRNKCAKNGADFHYKRVGEEIRAVTDEETGKVSHAKFIIVETSGTMIQQGWEFVAVLNHFPEGNVIRAFNTEVDVPSHYRSTTCQCEHCSTRRNRKETYLVRNLETGEFKQVGKSCLKEYTSGLSAENVAEYISWFDTVIKGEAPSGNGYTHYVEVSLVLRHAFETVKKFGYSSSSNFSDSTASKVHEFLAYYNNPGDRYDWQKQVKDRMERVGFNAFSEENDKLVEDSIQWATTQTEDSSSYMFNLKILCSQKYIPAKNFNILVSLAYTYLNHLDYLKKVEERKRVEAEKAASTEWVGNVKDKVEFAVKSARAITSWHNGFDITTLYEFVDNDNHIFTWATSNWVELDKKFSVKGTIKEHNEFRGCKQTCLTRCRITYIN